MNSLSIIESSIVSSEQDILQLKEKTKGKILVVSDSHGSVDILKKIIRDFGEDCDALVFCGDGICDLVECLEDAKEDDRFVQVIPSAIMCAKGNCDGSQYPVHFANVLSETNPETEERQYLNVQPMVTLNVAGRNIVCVHGNRHSVDYGTDVLSSFTESMNADMIFYGHTHQAHREEIGATLILNPGSCSRPRGGLPPTFAVVSFPGGTERYDVEFFEVKETLFGGYSFAPFPF